jgi:hypothetical protein
MRPPVIRVKTATEIPKSLPKLRAGLAVVTAGESLIVEGGPRRLRLTGTLATKAIPRLFELLDGRHNAEGISAELGMKKTQFEELVNLLSAHGLVERVPEERDLQGIPPHVRVYLSRAANLNSSDHLGTADVVKALNECVAVIVAPQPISAAITADLEETGIRRVHAYNNVADMSQDVINEVVSSTRGVVAVVDIGKGDQFDVVTSKLGESAVPIIRASAARSWVEIGPVFFGAESVCSACFGRSRDCGAAASCLRSPKSVYSQPYDLHASVAAGLITAEILTVTLRLGPPPTPGLLARYTLPQFTSTGWEVIPQPGCKACGVAIPADASAPFAEVCERQASLTPLGVLWEARNSYTRAVSTNSTRAGLEARRSPKHALPSGEADVSTVPGRITEHVLSRILLKTVGSGAGAPERASPPLPGIFPADEALGSVAIYVGSDNSASCLPEGIFRYDESEHTLVPVSQRVVPLAQLLRTTDVAAGPGDLAIVFVGAPKALSLRNAAAATRFAHFEAGYAALRLRMAVNAGVNIVFASCWGSDIAEILELGDHEIITAVALLSCRPSADQSEKAG